MSEILLCTLNARYIHASLGLRYLRANLGSYRERSRIAEFTISRPSAEIVSEILAANPRIVGFGVYIWNTTQTLEVVRLLKLQRPELLLVLGGPEVSFESEAQEIVALADFVFKGEADLSFRDFVANWLENGVLPPGKLIQAPLPEILTLALPYDEYSDEDLRHRVLYVEASRGCPYKCEYCLSALDVSVRNFDCERFLRAMERLLERGARRFKFVDRTFNLAPTISTRILEFFLRHIELGLFLHFEMVPDRLPEELKSIIQKFPRGALQFEIGIQTWNPKVARQVSRRQNYERIGENLRFLHSESGVHTHADLIVGLPGETWDSFVAGFNALYALRPDEIQVGLLKRLKGAPIIRHEAEFSMEYSPAPPFQILSTRDLSCEQIAQLKVFADFWDALANSGRFPGLREIVQTSADVSPFAFYFSLASHLHAIFGRTHSIHLNDLENSVRAYLEQNRFNANLGRAVRAKMGHLPARQSQHVAALL
jgi:radical SAM superfamily enzyme YgiQ (UPF0313 family)